MTDDQRDLQAQPTDDIGRRMADVIDDQDDEVTQHVDPHWEVLYDDEHDDAERIVHLHGEEKVPATVTAGADGASVATCTQCDASLEIAPATRAKATAGEAPLS